MGVVLWELENVPFLWQRLHYGTFCSSAGFHKVVMTVVSPMYGVLP